MTMSERLNKLSHSPWLIHIVIPLVLVASVLIASDNDYWVFLLTSAAVSYVLTASFNLVFGYAGLFSMASIAFYGIGAYASVYAENHWHLSFWPATLFAIVLAAVVGTVIVIPLSRLRAIFLAIATLGFAAAVAEIFGQWTSVTGGTAGIYAIAPPTVGSTSLVGGTVDYLWLCIIAVWLVAELTWRIGRSAYGRKLITLREAPRALAASGIDVGRLRISVFALSSGLAGLAGSLYAHFQLTISPEAFSFDRLIQLLLATVLGGAGTFMGPMLGVIALVAMSEVGVHLGRAQNLVYGLVVVALMVAGRQGVVGWIDALVSRLRGSRPAPPVDHRLLEAVGEQFASKPQPQAQLEIRDVSVQFSGVHAVQGASLTVEAGRVVGLVGPNGAGKTSLFNAVTGEVAATGEVSLDGVSLLGQRTDVVRRRGIARTFQLPTLVPQMTLLENVMIGGDMHSRAGLLRQMIHGRTTRKDDERHGNRALFLLHRLGIADRAYGRASEQPYGVQRLTEIARNLMLNPSVLLLDEPGAGLTGDERVELREVLDDLKKRGLGVLLIDHNISFVGGVSDHLAVLAQGKVIVEGRPREVLAHERVVEAYLGSSARRAHV
jgi:ABC-type branched-subunit amino acid transport system ATPase component/ABC-type branched-subunit amino acid transport system permease subunit